MRNKEFWLVSLRFTAAYSELCYYLRKLLVDKLSTGNGRNGRELDFPPTKDTL